MYTPNNYLNNAYTNYVSNTLRIIVIEYTITTLYLSYIYDILFNTCALFLFIIHVTTLHFISLLLIVTIPLLYTNYCYHLSFILLLLLIILHHFIFYIGVSLK